MEYFVPRPGRRVARRWNVAWPASFVIDGQCYPCTILDLSATGARIEGYGLRPVASVTTLRCDNFGELAARVKWVRGNRAGLRFERPAAEVKEILQRLLPGMGRREAPSAAAPKRAGFGRRRLVAA
jgi:hypothetical protein